MRAIHFIEKLKHTKGEWAGQRFRLEPWQQFVLWNIFGWKNADGTRRFRYAYIEIARKNGKTALSAGIGLYMLFADGESRPEVYSAATVKDQAKICFSDAVEIVKATDLKNYLTPYRNSIVYELKGGTMKPLSSDYGTHDGLNPSCGIIDEFHAHKDSGMFDVIKSAFGARRQPLMFVITTAGFNKSGACYAYRENVIKVLRGVNEDDSLFGIIYTLDDKSEWDDPKMWIKANPNLGVSLSADYLADQVKDAKNRPEAVRNVMTKNVDLWVDADVDTRRRLAKVHRHDRSRRFERMRLLGRIGPLERIGHYGLRAALPRERPFPVAAALLDSRREDAGEDPQREYHLR